MIPLRLSKFPVGLLELFRMRDNGRVPTLFSDEIDPSVDVTDFYGADILVASGSSAGAGVIGRTQSDTIAKPQRLLTIQGNLTIGAAAGTWLTLTVGFSIPGGTFGVQLGAVTFTPIIGGTYRVAAPVMGLVLPDGCQLFTSSEGNAGGADHVLQLRYAYQDLSGLR